jgi:hypothetical protein
MRLAAFTSNLILLNDYRRKRGWTKRTARMAKHLYAIYFIENLNRSNHLENLVVGRRAILTRWHPKTNQFKLQTAVSDV